MTILSVYAFFLIQTLESLTPLPFHFDLTAPLLASGFFSFGLFNLVPITDALIIENLHDAVIVTDERNRVSKINRAAKKWFNLSDDSIGADVFTVIPKPDLFRAKWEIPDAKIKFKIETDNRRVSYDAAITHFHQQGDIPLGRVIVIHDITQEQELLEAEFHHSAQMGLLEEVSSKIADSLNEQDVLQRSINTMIDYFGYAEVAVSLLTADNKLEIAAIAGTQDYGYQLKYKQELGKGVIGHTAAIRQTYIAAEVDKDPYYYSNEKHYGSAICIPLTNEKNLLGVLYIESAKSNAFEKNDVQTLETLAKQISFAMQRARLYENAQEHLRVMNAVQSISQVVSYSLELEKIYESVVHVLKNLFHYPYISIYLLKDDHLHLGAQYGYESEAISKIHIHQGISGRAVQTKQPQFLQDVSNDPNFLRFAEDITSEICVPLLKDNLILGTLNVEGKFDCPLTQKDADILTSLAGPIALAMDNARLHAQVKIAATTDPVSGLYNRRAFEETLEKEIERAARSNTPLSLIIFDVDSFKDYNDTWGHPAGDARLKATADMIQAMLRKYDIAARYGGDEFAIVLPDTDSAGAKQFAARLLDAARASAPSPRRKTKSAAGYTLSIGIATFPKDGDTFTSLVLAADHAELVAKRLGKNRIVTAEEINQ